MTTKDRALTSLTSYLFLLSGFVNLSFGIRDDSPLYSFLYSGVAASLIFVAAWLFVLAFSPRGSR